LPLTDAVPTAFPPLVQVVGGVACGPNTVKVIVPPAVLVAPVSVELIEFAAIGAPVVPLARAPAVVLVVLVTAVEVMPLPQELLEAPLLASPL
jgi:hypothetical protein